MTHLAQVREHQPSLQNRIHMNVQDTYETDNFSTQHLLVT